MYIVEPKVFMISAPRLRTEEVTRWLQHLGGLRVLDHMQGSPAERLIELAARRCYKSFDVGLNPNVTKVRTDSEEYHKNILSQRHGSVIAHAHVSFAIEDVSRVFTHELVRNSTGNDISFGDDCSQESLRYVRLSNMGFWMPPEIAADPWAQHYFKDVVAQMEQWQQDLADHYDIDNIKDFNRKKKLTSAFRRIAPMGLATGLVITHSMRALRWVIEQRTDYAAEHEIRLVYNRIAEISQEEWPFLFRDFIRDYEQDSVPAWKPDYSKV